MIKGDKLKRLEEQTDQEAPFYNKRCKIKNKSALKQHSMIKGSKFTRLKEHIDQEATFYEKGTQLKRHKEQISYEEALHDKRHQIHKAKRTN